MQMQISAPILMVTQISTVNRLQYYHRKMMHSREQNKAKAEKSKGEEEEEQKRIERHNKLELVKQKSKGVWATNPKPNEPTAVWVASGNCDKAYWVKFTPPSWASLPLTAIKPSGWDPD